MVVRGGHAAQRAIRVASGRGRGSVNIRGSRAPGRDPIRINGEGAVLEFGCVSERTVLKIGRISERAVLNL